MKTPMTDAVIEDARNVALEFECRNPQPKPDENIYVVPADFARQLEQDLNTCKRALEKIRDEDYRGNKHSSHFIAKKALEEL